MANARHSKAGSFVRQKFFAGVSSFAELERRISSLSEIDRGSAFEVFAEAYLATQRKHDADVVWPLATAPLETLKHLHIYIDDYGVDGILKTKLGQFAAYQVKFRTGRPPLQWNGDKLSNFFAQTDTSKIHSRILFTNCDELPDVLKDRHGYFPIRGSDLDRLEAEDFKAIEAWLADSIFAVAKKTRQPHQTEALEKILPAIKIHDRVSAIMACGTGKTLVALWMAEHIQAQRIIVLLPSLALLRQTLHEWLRETNISSLAYLCVCHDPSVKYDLDALQTQQTDLDFPVSTDAVSVRRFLDAEFAGCKVVFSTYQSARLVGMSLKPDEGFDLGIFDEAHKTAGPDGRNFAFALEDKNLSIRKRLFLTATPRHYNPLQRNSAGDARLVFSMDKPGVYGPQIYQLPFGEAADRGIICRYKVIISVITSHQVTNELLSRGEVLVNGDPIRARQVANQIALKDSIKKYGVNKIFTFHSTVASAASFTSNGNEGVTIHLPEFKAFHVNGAMPTVSRDRVMRDFRDSRRGIVSNARCLTEGVDVPAVDMVAFLAPRRSRVDIIQATGRAMRKADGKEFGYVLVPLYVEQAFDESVEQAVLRSDFSDVWSVLQSLQEHDEGLQQTIQNMRTERGRTKGFDDSRFREQIIISGPNISLQRLREVITTQCVSVIGENWHERYGQLLTYKATHGDCNVPKGFSENKVLAGWVIRQRTLFKKKQLEASRIALLNEVGFVWNPTDALWFENYARLVKYHEKYQTCRVPQDWAEDKTLGKWVSTQRVYFNRRWLTKERVALLNKLNFEWTGEKATWELRFEELKAFKKRFGHTRVPVRWKENRLLGIWASDQRYKRRNKIINKEHERLLDSEAFDWETQNAGNPGKSSKFWERQIQAILRFKAEHGHFVVPRKGKALLNLAHWMSEQRSKYKSGKVPPELKAQLDAIGFPWVSQTKPGTSDAWKSIYDKHWQEMYNKLKSYVSNHGSTEIVVTDEDTRMLKSWVKAQKDAKRDKRLNPEKTELLEGLRFVWAKTRPNGRTSFDWDEMLDQLKAYVNAHGTTNVIVKDTATARLKAWIKSQKDTKRRNNLSPDKIQALNQIGFIWAKAKLSSASLRLRGEC